MIINTTRHAAITGIDDDLGLVFGWASVSSVNGRPLIDKQGEIIPPDEMLKAATAFMADARLAKVQHQPGGIGEILHSFPLTAEIAKACGIRCALEGWLIGMRVSDREVFKAIRSGKLTGFSIGATYTAKEAA